MSANLFAKYISALFAVALLTGCKEPECDSSMDCTGGAMCVSGVCRETAAGSTDADNPIDPVTPVHTNNNDTATDDTDSHTDSEPMPTSDTGAEIIHLDSDSDTTIDPDADLGCRHDYTDYATCSTDWPYSFATLTEICDILYIGGCPIQEDCLGKCEFLWTDTETNDIETATEFYYTVEGINESALQSYCFALNGEWQLCEF